MTSTSNGPSTAPNIADAFLDETVTFPNGQSFKRLRPITDLRKDPGEARILYTCRRVLLQDGTASKHHEDSEAAAAAEYIMKIKVQWPGPQNILHEGPSPYTTAELTALQKFSEAGLSHVPHLITWKRAIQGPEGIHPGGYIIYMVITKMPGLTLFDLGYWSQSKDRRAEIQAAFLATLKRIRALGIAPYDCALRNVLWDSDARVCSVVDFEHYREGDPESCTVLDEIAELQNWGLAQRPPPGTWHVEWARGH